MCLQSWGPRSPGMTEDRECLKAENTAPGARTGTSAGEVRCRLRMRPGATVLEARSKGTKRGGGDRRVSRPQWGTLCPSHPSLSAPARVVARGLNSALHRCQARREARTTPHTSPGAGGVLPRGTVARQPGRPDGLSGPALRGPASIRCPPDHALL